MRRRLSWCKDKGHNACCHSPSTTIKSFIMEMNLLWDSAHVLREGQEMELLWLSGCHTLVT